MKDVSLHMIVKDEVEEIEALLSGAVSNYFEAVYLTVSDKQAYHKINEVVVAAMHKNVHVDHRPWTNRFDEARNHNFALGNTQFQFWIDADDTFDFSKIPQLVRSMHEEELDAIFLPYNYAQDDQGRCVVRHWRERMLRRSVGFEWRGWIHETAIVDHPIESAKFDFEVKHNTSPDHAKESTARNHAILEKAYLETDDPRYVHYLGMSYFTYGEHERAIEVLGEYVALGSPNTEDVYRSLTLISEAAYHIKDYSLALEYATKAATYIPEYPMAYWLLAQYEADQEEWDKALEWVKVSMSKPDPTTMTIFDPTSRERAVMIAAQAEFMLGNHNRAFQWLKKAPQNKTAKDLYEHFRTEADIETFYTLIPQIRSFFESDEALFDALNADIKYDNRAIELRHAATKPTKWGDNSIVIFCGQGYEEWGPHTLGKGMGGSEEAIVYLSIELAKLGYDVTVYGEYDSGTSHLVSWRPWKQIDIRDEFSVFVSWRDPRFATRVNAKVKLADIHDVMPDHIMQDFPDITYLVKTAYHKSLSPQLKDENVKIIGNGIKKEQFND